MLAAGGRGQPAPRFGAKKVELLFIVGEAEASLTASTIQVLHLKRSFVKSGISFITLLLSKPVSWC